jgi:transmembrane sensor
MDRSDAKPRINTQILEEAADWLIELNSGGADHALRQRFDAWLRTSPEHVRAYLEMLPIWEDGASLPTSGDASIDELLALGKQDTNVVSLSSEEAAGGVRRAADDAPRFPGWWPRGLAVAATIVIAVGASVGWWLHGQRGTYATDIGEQRSLSLEDGSTINLNARSKVRVRFGSERRAVELLEGQALFKVAKDAARPFVVEVDGTRVRAVGTQFDVSRRRRGTVVTVLEGSVAVSPEAPATFEGRTAAPRADQESNGAVRIRSRSARDDAGAPDLATSESVPSRGLTTEVVITAGEQVTVSGTAASRTVRANLAHATAWTQGQLVFDASTLGEVVDEFNRYNNRPLVIRDTALASFPITAAFASADPAPLVRFLERQANIRVTETGEAIEISSRP